MQLRNSKNKRCLKQLFAFLIPVFSVLLSNIVYGSANDVDILSDLERTWLTENQSRLVLAVESNYAPFVFLDSNDKPAGLANDYFQLIEKKLGVRFKQERFRSLEDILNSVRRGEVQIVNAVTSTPERAQFLSMTEPYFSVSNVIIVRKDRPNKVTEWTLDGLNVSMVKSYAVTQYMPNYVPGIAVDSVPDDLTALLQVSFGQSDAAIIDLATASYLISENGLANLRVDGKVPFDINLAIGTSINEPILLSILQKGLNAITDEERQEINNRWFNTKGSVPFFTVNTLSYLTIGFFVVAGLAIVIVFVQKRSLLIQALLPTLILSIGSLGTYIYQSAAMNAAQNVLQNDFSREAEEVVYRIQDRLAVYHQILRGTKGLFIASDVVERDDFREFVAGQRLDEHFPGVQGIGFSLVINADEKNDHIQAIRQEGFPNYVLRPEGTRDLYTSIVYLEPFDYRNQRAFGYDMFSEPVRRQAMEQSRDADAAALSGKVLLVQETENDVQAGVLIYVPIYQKGKPIGTVAERKDSILGWVYSPFRMNDLMSGIVGNKTNLLSLQVYDGAIQSKESLLFNSENGKALSTTGKYHYSQQLNLVGHDWTVSMQSLPSFEETVDTAQVTFIRTIGGSLTLGLSMLVWFLSSGRSRAVSLAKRMTVQLNDSITRYDRLAANIPVGVYLLRTHYPDEFNFEYVSPKFCSVLNVNSEAVYVDPQLPFGSIHPDDVQEFLQVNETSIQNQTPFFWEGRSIHTGRVKWLRIESTPERQEDDGRCLWDGMVTDITDSVNSSEKIRQLAFFDELTKLPNRRLLYDRLDQFMAISKRSNLYGALMFIDLDNFKSLNDKHGHSAGDLLLIEVANRLKSCLREMDTVARMGGDEFVVLLSELDKETSASKMQSQRLAEKILLSLSEPYILRVGSEESLMITVEHRCTASIGVVIFRNHDDNQDDILKHADAAMYRAKALGRNTVCFYESSTDR